MSKTPPLAGTQHDVGSKRPRWVPLLIGVVLLLILLGSWRFTPLSDLIEPRTIASELREISRSPWAVLWIIGIYIAANAVMIPNAALNTATILALGAPTGFIYAMTGSLSAGVVAFLLGRRLGLERLKSLNIPGLDALSKLLRRGGILGVAVVRQLPIAPYSVVNTAMGALRVKFVPFFVGSAIGLLPGTLAVSAVGHRIESMFRKGIDAQGVAILTATGVAIVLLMLYLRRWAKRQLDDAGSSD